MRKISLLALAAFFAGTAFAQAAPAPAAPAVKRTFRVYMDAISGDIVNQKAGTNVSGTTSVLSPNRKMWQGNEFEIGLVYGQNWAKAPWLTTRFALKTFINPDWAYDASGNPTARSGGIRNWQLPRGQVDLDLTRYFSIYMDTRLLFGATAQYYYTTGAHTVGFQAGLELFMGNFSVSGEQFTARRKAGLAPDRTFGADFAGAGPIIDAFWLDFVWTAQMGKGFANTFLFRPVGFGGDSADEIAEGLLIRIQDTISWSNNGFSMYIRVRYNIRNIAFPTYELTAAPGTYWKTDIRHDLSLRAGLSYSYNFGAL